MLTHRFGAGWRYVYPAALLLCGAAGAIGQIAPQPSGPAANAPANESEEERRKRLEALAKEASSDAIALTPFEVKADLSDTYEATNTNSVTGTNTPLSKTPLDAKVFNRQMMDELGVVDMTEMLSKLAGLGPAVINADDDVRGTLEGDRQDPKSMTMRGLQINNPRRDGFLRSDTTLLDSFDIERVEAIGGSNSLLFGSGDAGGVITSASKRAYLNRRPTATVTAMGDSEGSRRYTLDAQAGNRMFAARVNAVKSDIGNFRPGLRQQSEGYHIAATFQPWKRLQIRGEFRDFERDTIFAQAVTVRAPTNLLLPAVDRYGYPIPAGNARRFDNQNSRYLVGFPETAEFFNGVFDVTKVDSAVGPFHRDAYFNQIKSVVAEATLAEGLAVQLRYGQDARVNEPLRASSTTVFAPGATGNNYVDPETGRAGTAWAMNTSMNATPYWTGARGYRAALAYQKDLRRGGRHQFSLFRQDMQSWTNQQPWRFYEVDQNGDIIQNLANIANADSGRNVMPATWIPAFSKSILGDRDWFTEYVKHPNGRTYKYAPQIYAGAVPATERNPMGLSGPIAAADNAAGTVLAGQSTVTGYFLDDIRETSWGASLFSEWWKGRVDTMLGYRLEEASTFRNNTGVQRGPITYDSLTAGTVFDTPIRGLRVSLNYSTNAKINFDTTRDIFNATLPPGEGESRDIGLKFDLWDRRISGNFNYYVSEAQNFVGTLGDIRDDVDPNGINGRNGGNAFTYSKKSDGFNLTLSSRPVKGWEIRLNIATADGQERQSVILPQFYNDEFNTMTLNGEQVVAIKNGGSTTPLMVPVDPLNPEGAQMPLSLATLRNQDPANFYRAIMDPDSGRILNAEQLGMFTPGVGTGATGLPIAQHQLGFTSPHGGSVIVRLAGERTTRYAERSYSLINRYQFTEGRLRGLVVGLSTSVQEGFRAYMYNDSLDGNKRKTFYFPDKVLNDFFAIYRFNVTRRVRSSVQINVTNLFDTNEVIYLRHKDTGAFRYAQWLNAPRKLSISTAWNF